MPHAAFSGRKETHLHTGKLQNIVVGELASLWADRLTIHEWVVALLSTFDVNDIIAFGPSRNGGNLYTWATQCGQCFGQFQIPSGKGAAQDLKFCERQRNRRIAWIDTCRRCIMWCGHADWGRCGWPARVQAWVSPRASQRERRFYRPALLAVGPSTLWQQRRRQPFLPLRA